MSRMDDYTTYPAVIREDERGFSVKLRTVANAFTCGRTYDEAVRMAEALVLDVADIEAGQAIISSGDRPRDGETGIKVSPDTALKIMLRNAMFTRRISVAELARRLSISNSQIRDALSLRRAANLATLRDCFQAVGAQLQIAC